MDPFLKRQNDAHNFIGCKSQSVSLDVLVLSSKNVEDIYSALSTESGDHVADALLAVGGREDVVDAGLDLLDRVQVAAVSHCL